MIRELVLFFLMFSVLYSETVDGNVLKIAYRESNRIVFLGKVNRSGEFSSAIFSPTVKIDSLGDFSWDNHGDSLKLLGIYNNCDVELLINSDRTIILDSLEPAANFHGEFTECIEFVNFISLATDEIKPSSKSELLFSQNVAVVKPIMNTFDTLEDLSQFDLLDSLSDSQKNEITKYGGREDSFQHSFTAGSLIQFDRWGVRDYQFGNGPKESSGTRVIFHNDTKVWPEQNCFYYHSHASGAGINCMVSDFYPWYEWNGVLFTFTISYEPHRVVGTLLVINDNRFRSYQLFDQQPECG